MAEGIVEPTLCLAVACPVQNRDEVRAPAPAEERAARPTQPTRQLLSLRLKEGVALNVPLEQLAILPSVVLAEADTDSIHRQTDPTPIYVRVGPMQKKSSWK